MRKADTKTSSRKDSNQGLQPPYRWQRLGGVRRGVTYVVWAVATFGCVGGILFPEWWYAFLWQHGFLYPQNYLALPYAARDQPLLTAMGLLGCSGLIFVAVSFRGKLRPILDRWAFVGLAVPILLSCLGALLLNSIERRKWVLVANAQNVVEAADDFLSTLATITRVPLDAPVSFYYLDASAIDSMYAQIGPDLIETSHSEKRTSTQGGALSADALPIKATAEAASSLEASTQYAPAPSSAERRALKLVRFCLENNRATILQDRPLLILRQYTERSRRSMDTVRRGLANAIDPSLDRQMDQLAKETLERMKRVEEEVDSKLENPPDFLLLAIPVSKGDASGSKVTLVGKVSRRTDAITVKIVLPTNVELPELNTAGPYSLRIFGHVISRNQSQAELKIQAIAIF